jgi:type III secretory pathway component EscR
LALYLLANLFIVGQEKYYEQKLKNYDINENGFFEENERTEKKQIIQEKVASDTARNLAPITTIPVIIVIIVFGFLFWSTLKIVERKKLA